MENIIGKRENVRNRHCLLFPQSFQKPSAAGCLYHKVICYMGVVSHVIDIVNGYI